jgi:hypothetical protein
VVEASYLCVETSSRFRFLFGCAELHSLIIPDAVDGESLAEFAKHFVVGSVDSGFQGLHLLFMLLHVLLGL